MSNELVRCQMTIELDLGSEDVVKTVYTALEPETHTAPSERAVTSFEQRGSILVIKIEAGDLTAMRAATNSFLSWISACVNVINLVLGQNP